MIEKINQLQQELYATLKQAAHSRRKLTIFRTLCYGGALLYFIGIVVVQVLMFSGNGGVFFQNDYTLNPNPTFFEQNKILFLILPLFVLITIGGIGLSSYFKKFTEAEQVTIRRIFKTMFPDAKLALLPSEVSSIVLHQSNFFGKASNVSGQSLGMVVFENNGQKITFRDMLLNTKSQTKSSIGGFLIIFQMMFKGIFGARTENIASTFRGLFANAVLEKKINGSVVVLPDRLESKLDYLAKNIQALKSVNGNKLVTLEDVEFERYFAVYASDEILARYVLTPAMMLRMTELKKKYNRDIMLSFNDNQFFFAVAMPEGFLTLGGSSLASGEALKDLYDNFATAQGILNDLKLNSKNIY